MKQLLVLFIAVGLAGAVQAQSNSLSSEENKAERVERTQSPEAQAKMRLQRMTKELELSPEQQKAVYNVLLSQATERERHQIQRAEARKRAEADRQRSEAKIMEVLDADQKILWEKKKAEMHEKRAERVEQRRDYKERRMQPESK